MLLFYTHIQKHTKRWLSVGLLTLGLAGSAQAQQLAFPGAEGAGKYTTGGRGTTSVATTVFEVTSLEDTNTPGTLRYAVSQASSVARYRTVVFRVCGTIHLNTRLSIPANTTLAGQTAPGDGICVADRQVSVSGNNVIIRFMRFRLGDRYQNLGMVDGSGNDDALSSQERKNIVIDHCTMSWSDDEAFTFYGAATDSMTLQWNLISEPLNYSYHFETGDADYEKHGYGGIWGGQHASFHHNLFAHCSNRTPRWNGTRYGAPVGSENCDFRNNVIYNWGSNNVYGGEGGNYNMVNNYYKYGPSTSTSARYRVVNPYKQTSTPVLPYPKIYLTGNYVDGSPATTNRNWLGVIMNGGTVADTVQSRVTAPFAVTPITTTQTAEAAYAAVLQGVGCVLPTRDAVDARIIQEVQDRKGTIIDVQGGFPHGTPYSTSQVAWPVLACGPGPTDTDHDGMPDTWETSHGLNPNDPADRSLHGPGGYTALENYLNSLTTLVTATQPKAKMPGLEVYPNPAQDRLTVAHPHAGRQATLTLYTSDGRKVATFVSAPGSTETSVPLGALAKGIYFVRYADERTYGVTKFVRQ